MTRRWKPALLLASCLLAACGGSGTDDTVLVLAAASLTDVFQDMEVAFERANPGIDIEISTAGSSELRVQIDHGAPADVVAIANERVMIELAGEGHVRLYDVFATNELVVAAAIDNPAGLTELADLANDDHNLGLCTPDEACGAYALEALAAAGISATADTEESDAHSLMNKIAAGELDAGVVYATDAASRSDDIVIIASLPGIDIPYPIATLTDSPHPKAADAFVAFVLSDAGRAILTKSGFGAA